MRRIVEESRPARLRLLLLLAVDFLSTPLMLLATIPLKVAVDSVIGNHPLPQLLHSLVPSVLRKSTFRVLLLAAPLELLIVLLSELQDTASYVLHTQLGERLTLGFRARLFWHSQRLSLLARPVSGWRGSLRGACCCPAP
jgi:hypothetical protein